MEKLTHARPSSSMPHRRGAGAVVWAIARASYDRSSGERGQNSPFCIGDVQTGLALAAADRMAREIR